MSVGSKVVVITGASGGIGAAVARKLGNDGWSVVLAARRRAELDGVAAESGGRTLTVVTDVTRRRDVEVLRDQAIAAFGQVDVWINNAGRGITKPALELSDEEFDDMMTTNVKSALYGMQAIIPHFIERGSGQIINVSSFLGRVPVATHRSAYNAAKAALNALTANVRVDLQSRYPGIHVTLVMPGLVATEFAKNASGGRAPVPPPAGAPAGSMKPQTAEEVADVIANVIARPVSEVYTNPASAAIARAYFEDVAAFEERMRGASGTAAPR